MSNLEEITLRPIQVERFQAEAALQCIFHTIVFSRSLWSTVKPRDVNCEAFDISYVQNGNPVVARRISTGIRLFLRNWMSPSAARASRVSLFTRSSGPSRGSARQRRRLYGRSGGFRW